MKLSELTLKKTYIAIYLLLANVPALSCRCMTYAYLKLLCLLSLLQLQLRAYLQSTMATCSLLQLPVVNYGYLWSTMVTCTLLWLPVVYFSYLQSTISTCSLIWLPVVYHGYLQSYYGYLQSTIATCSLLWATCNLLYTCSYSTMHCKNRSMIFMPNYHWNYTKFNYGMIPVVIQYEYHTSDFSVCLPSLHYTNLCAAQSALPTQLAYAIVCSVYPKLYTLSGLYMTIQSAMPKQSSELPIAFCARLVSLSNIRSILIKCTVRNSLYQAM